MSKIWKNIGPFFFKTKVFIGKCWSKPDRRIKKDRRIKNLKTMDKSERLRSITVCNYVPDESGNSRETSKLIGDRLTIPRSSIVYER